MSVDTIISSLSTITAALLGGAYGFWLARRSVLSSTARERLDKVYSIAFYIVEPVLYKHLSYKEARELVIKLKNIVDGERLLADPDFHALIHRFLLNPQSDEDYQTTLFLIYNHIDRTFDWLCSKAGLPVRSYIYRMNARQYSNKVHLALSILRFSLPPLLPFIFLIIVLIASRR